MKIAKMDASEFFEHYTWVYEQIWENKFEFVSDKICFDIVVCNWRGKDNINVHDFPFTYDGKYFWEYFTEDDIELLKSDKAFINLSYGIEMASSLILEKFYKLWELIPDYIRDNVLLSAASTHIEEEAKIASNMYDLPKLNVIYYPDLLDTKIILKGGYPRRRSIYSMYFDQSYYDKFENQVLDNGTLNGLLFERGLKEDRNKKYTFLVRRPREERIELLSLLNEGNYIKDGHVSCPREFNDNVEGDPDMRNTLKENENIKRYNPNLEELDNRHKNLYHRIYDGYMDLENKLPIIRDTETWIDWSKPTSTEMTWENFTDAYINITMETSDWSAQVSPVSTRKYQITEKTIRPIYCGQIVVPFGAGMKNARDTFKLMGFKPYIGINYDYDLELNYYSKFDKYWKEVERLINMSNSDLKQLWLDNRDVIVHNITNYCHMKWFGSYGNKFFRVQ